MPRIRALLTALVVALAVALLPSALAAQAGGKVDVTGKWQFTITTDQGTGTPTVTLKQQGDSITGHYSSQMLGERDLSGTVKDGKITFTIKADMQGNTFVLTYSGTVESADTMKGTVDFAGQAGGTFTAKKQA